MGMSGRPGLDITRRRSANLFPDGILDGSLPFILPITNMDCVQLQGTIKQNNKDWTSGDHNSKKKNGCYVVLVWK